MALGVDRSAAGHGGQVLVDRHQALLSSLKIVGIQGCDGALAVAVGLQQSELFRDNGVHSHVGDLSGWHHRQAEQLNRAVALGFAGLFPGQAQAGDPCIGCPGRQLDPNGHMQLLAKPQVGQLPVAEGGLRQVVENVDQFCAIAGADAKAEALGCRVGEAGELVGVKIRQLLEIIDLLI